MIGILRSLREGLQAGRLRRRQKVDQRSDSTVQLVRLLVAKGLLREAMEAVAEGLERFPYCVRLIELRRFIWRDLKGGEVRTLRRRTAEAKDAEAHRELVSIHRLCEDYDAALDAAEAWQQSLGDDCDDLALAETLLAQAEILGERFLRDQVAVDGRRAIALLKRVLDVSPDRSEAHLGLFRIYEAIGAVSRALLHLGRLSDLDPDDEDLKAHFVAMSSRPIETADENTLLRDFEDEADREEPGESTEADPAERRQFAQGAARLSQLNDVRRVVCLDGRLATLAQGGEIRPLDDPQEDELCRLARGFARAAGAGSRRMGIGSARSCVIQCGDRILLIHSAQGCVVLVECEGRRHEAFISAECTNFLAACLWRRQEREPVHA